MSEQPPFDPQDSFGGAGSLKENDLCTLERGSRPGTSFSPVPLFSPLSLKYEYECGADEVPCKTKTNVDDPNLHTERHVVRRNSVAGQCSGPLWHVSRLNLCRDCEFKW